MEELGSGAFSTVMLVRERGQEWALKKISKAQFGRNYLLSSLEVKNDLRLNHKHIISHYDSFETADFYYLKMELARGGTLKELMVRREEQGFTEAEVAQAGNAILSGIIYIHRQNIIHRDIKPENIVPEKIIPTYPLYLYFA